MTTPRIDEIINKIVEVGKQRADMFEPSAEVILATTAKEQMLKVHQTGDKDGYERGRKAGIDKAVEIVSSQYTNPNDRFVTDEIQLGRNAGIDDCINALQNNK